MGEVGYLFSSHGCRAATKQPVLYQTASDCVQVFCFYCFYCLTHTDEPLMRLLRCSSCTTTNTCRRNDVQELLNRNRTRWLTDNQLSNSLVFTFRPGNAGRNEEWLQRFVTQVHSKNRLKPGSSSDYRAFTGKRCMGRLIHPFFRNCVSYKNIVCSLTNETYIYMKQSLVQLKHWNGNQLIGLVFLQGVWLLC